MTTPNPPAVSSVTFDKSVYNVGETITVTIDFSGGSSDQTVTVTVMVKDDITGETVTMTASFTVVDPDASTVTVSDSGNRTWTPVSNSNGVAVFTTIA